MAKEFKLPDIGEGVHEGEITKWLVEEGQDIKEDDPMVEVMTDKVTVEIPSPFAGKVLKLLAKEGEVVTVGTAILVVGEEGEAVPEAAKEEKVEEAAKPTARKPEAPAAPAGRVLATPAVRKLARELGVDLARVKGTGPRGRITEADVRALPAEPEVAAPVEAAAAEGLVERVPLRGVRRRIADKMHRSKNTAAHFTYVEEVDMTNLVHLRERAKALAEKRGVKLTYLPFIVKALVTALKEHPWLNGTMDDERNEFLMKRYYNIGIATATDQGLVVPVVKDADQKDVFRIAKDVDDLATRAREGKLKLADLQDGTFTITSLGAMGGMFATPIINYPEVAIVGIHKIEPRPVVRNGRIVVRDMMYLSCSFDHRIVDGHVGAAFVQTLGNYLEHPAMLFMGLE
jgi:pyruvate dehydrogenase E2 component (dihydrolipoamide acetyltransferase)